MTDDDELGDEEDSPADDEERDQAPPPRPSRHRWLAEFVANPIIAVVGLLASIAQVEDFVETGKLSTLLVSTVALAVALCLGVGIPYLRTVRRRRQGGRVSDLVIYGSLAVALGSIVTIAVSSIFALTRSEGVTVRGTSPATAQAMTPAPTPSTAGRPTTASASPNGWFDDFSDGAIDSRHWQLESDQKFIYAQGGVLNLAAPDGHGDISYTDGNNPRMIAVTEGRPIKEFEFDAIFDSASPKSTSGGACGALFDPSGREYSAYIGPGSAIHHIEFAQCLPPKDDCTSKAGPEIEIGQGRHIRMTWTAGRIDVFVDGRDSAVYSWPAPEAPNSARLGMYADRGSAFKVAIDNVRVGLG